MQITKTGPFELAFWGGVGLRYRRTHLTFKSAEAEALRVLAKLPNRNAHPAVIYQDGHDHPIATVN